MDALFQIEYVRMSLQLDAPSELDRQLTQNWIPSVELRTTPSSSSPDLMDYELEDLRIAMAHATCREFGISESVHN